MAIKCPGCGYDNTDSALCCNLCGQVLRREDQPPKFSFGRRFEGFARFVAVEMVKEPLFAGLGIELDYSPASLQGVDAAVDLAIGAAGEAPELDIADYNPGKEKFGTQVGLGSYYGEVCRRVLGGVWQQDPRWNKELGPDAEFILARMVFGGLHVFPIGKAIRRYKNGAKSYFFPEFQELARRLGVPCQGWGRGFVKQAGLILDRGTLPLSERAPVIGQFCKLGLGYDADLGGDVMVLAARLSKLPAEQAPAPDPKILQAAGHILNGELLLNAGRFAEAIGSFEEALKLDPADPRAWEYLAVAQYRAGRFKEALDCCTKALELEPGNAEILLWQAMVLDKSGERVRALRQAEAVFADPALLASLKKKPFKDYACLISQEISPELKKLITEKLA
ncbi:MAG: hypothetical protein A3J79_06215 [Elusimicrobia bacterium RIFOXYB2_FULL_62_6]|nr:MAG: hypothetical protein A3J79_06215 [Elusimicrobia bacterium RIFOXYB2_FULL_62_6]